MNIIQTDIPDVLVIEPKVFEDERGFFMEVWNQQTFEAAGITTNFIQDNHSKSPQGTLRGLHYQVQHTQGKLVRVISGEVYDVVVDIRKDSAAFGKWVSVLISAENKQQVWIPGGLAHGFSVLSETAEFCYKVTDYYHPEDEAGICWNDPQLNIDWQVQTPILSEKDKNLPLFTDIEF